MNKPSNIDKSIAKNIKTIIKSPNPYKFVINVFKFHNDIKQFIENSLEKINQLSKIDEDRIEKKVIKKLKKSDYHHTWLEFMSDYIIASRHWKDKIYIDSLCYSKNISQTNSLKNKYQNHKLQRKIEEKDLKQINFKQTKTLIDQLQSSLISDKKIAKLNKSITKQIDNIIQNYPQNKYKIHKRLNNLLDSKNVEKDKEKYKKYFKTNIIKKHFPDSLKCIYWKISSLPLDQKEYNKLKTHIDGNGISDKFKELKSFILQFNSFIFAPIFKPILLHKITETLKINIHTKKWKKIRYFMLFYLSNNYEEYTILRNFLNELEGFLNNDTSIKFKIWFFWILSLPLFILLMGIFAPIGVFIPIGIFSGNILYKIFQSIRKNTEYKIKFKFGINIALGVSITAILSSNLLMNEKKHENGASQIFNMLNHKSVVEIVSANINKYKNTNQKQKVSNEKDSKKQKEKIEQIKKDKKNTQKKGKQNKKTKITNKDLFNNQVKLGNGIYLWNLIDKVLTTYQIEYSYQLDNIQKQVLMKNIAKQYTTINIDKFRKDSIALYSGRLQWDKLNKWIPKGFKVDMNQLEKIVVYNLQKLENK